MNIQFTAIADVLIIEPTVFGDARGHFFESFNQRRFEALTGVTSTFVQDNQSRSARAVLRERHYASKNNLRKRHSACLKIHFSMSRRCNSKLPRAT